MKRIIQDLIIKNYYILYIVMILGILSVSSLAVASLFPYHASAESVDYQVNVSPTLTVAVTSDGIATDQIKLNLNPANHNFDHQTLDVSVATNNITGYQLLVSTPNNNTNLIRDDSSDGIDSAIATLSNPTSDSTSSSFENNKWGYRIIASDTDAGSVTNNYLPFASNTILSVNHHTTNGDNTTLDFAAKIDWNQPAGVYENTLILAAVATYAAYNINYYNGYDNSSTIATQTDSYNTSSTVKLEPGITPTRSTYTFKSWCLGNNTGVSVNTDTRYDNTAKIYSNPATICNGTEYSTGDNITINPEDYNTNLSLYAVWTPTTFAQAYGSTAMTMQNITSAICNKVTVNQYATLTDNRDNQAYTIGRLEDGRCWMADNLNFDAYTNRNSITTSNTHIDANSSAILTSFRSGNRTAGDQYTTGGINSSNSSGNNWTTSYSYSVPLQNRSGKCDPSINSSYQCLSPYQNANYTYNTVINKYGTPASDTSGTANVTYNIGPGSYKIGTYYNFCAASLGSYCYGDGTSAGTSATGNATEADICPKGWRLPYGGASGTNSGEYQKLRDAIYAKYPSTVQSSTSPFSLQTMLSTPVSGRFRSATVGWQGSYGGFWSSSYYSAAIMYDLYVSGTGVDLQDYSNRYGGYSVRCIAQN